MKILITGADVLYNEVNQVYEVIYKNRKVFEDRFKNSAIMFALNRDKLNDAIELSPTSNVVYMTARVG